ncbi:endoplasmic reticulum-resident kdel protein [Apiospora rasikravindrae]|uniref:Endoplasmic reticulum-resident kdel protein n=1 Tax=Apiospora rasikravindrae TaxID=990691 RepID=A0ABR1SYQ8_9PEZI
MECRKAFPGLFDELLRAKQQYEKYHVNLDDLEDIDINDGRQNIPNIEFVLDVRGQTADVTKPVWVLDRREQDDKVWLTPFIGSLETSNTSTSGQEAKRDDSQTKFTFKSLGQIAAEIDSQESQGSLGKNGRRGETEDVSTTDDWGAFLLTSNPPRPNMTAPDVCHHKILLHSDSQSTFNRLDSLLCASVNVMQSPKWIHLYHGLMYSKPMNWSRSSLPNFQNVMLVDKSGPDLQKGTPGFLRNSNVANDMASNAVETFRHRYLTEASTACYWRELIHTYSEVSYSPEVYDEMGSRRGVPLERFL